HPARRPARQRLLAARRQTVPLLVHAPEQLLLLGRQLRPVERRLRLDGGRPQRSCRREQRHREPQAPALHVWFTPGGLVWLLEPALPGCEELGGGCCAGGPLLGGLEPSA